MSVTDTTHPFRPRIADGTLAGIWTDTATSVRATEIPASSQRRVAREATRPSGTPALKYGERHLNDRREVIGDIDRSSQQSDARHSARDKPDHAQ